MNCKVRFAPSPTGFMHVGNARIAIINHLFCRKNNGKFLFRIDDTDVLRSKKEYEDAIKADMNWLGIGYDETFRQSERLERYHEVMEKLIADGFLY
ncbi:MAG: glutamate--tRNA ligase, partial [Alphaproteobacteria bacterium]|nr:glutamate--tRNA ligase [Alphaproteobacteria bacterium]